MTTKTTAEGTISTEDRIKNAARQVFTNKGFAATRTRDIAEVCGLNVALINYYFRSKEKLFDIIMMEQLHVFVGNVTGLLDDPNTSLHQKIELLINYYIDLLIANPGLPTFILNEVNKDPEKFVSRVQFPDLVKGLRVQQQWQEMVSAGKAPKINPIQLFLNVISMTVFPFIVGPLIRNKADLTTEAYNELMLERKKLIPMWLKAIFQIPAE